ncbi:MAG TPA: hypothetical protein VME45_08810 [Stellaceae bacterium]|nr:hypothetical protein [Stellaceae bacterium]
MNCLTWTRWRAQLLLSGAAALLALSALTAGPPPAQARGWVSIGGPCCGYWGPGPYWGYPPPYGYYPPPAYYPPTPPYPVPGYPPPAPAAYAPAPAAAPAAPGAAPGQPQITYTGKPAFTNAAGQTCREYKTNAGGRDVFGTACQQTDGQWRVVN